MENTLLKEVSELISPRAQLKDYKEALTQYIIVQEAQLELLKKELENITNHLNDLKTE